MESDKLLMGLVEALMKVDQDEKEIVPVELPEEEEDEENVRVFYELIEHYSQNNKRFAQEEQQRIDDAFKLEHDLKVWQEWQDKNLFPEDQPYMTKEQYLRQTEDEEEEFVVCEDDGYYENKWDDWCMYEEYQYFLAERQWCREHCLPGY